MYRMIYQTSCGFSVGKIITDGNKFTISDCIQKFIDKSI
ncbi:hypothetical protein EHF_0270 [Ehrlichia japonica]|uniref:Uncharacterized protein n=1 Tax=Ehrlichia japonica TaxID=391036 RepID=X5H190_9RICK|nr:hypothetical protein EHF_0270 [Ehrlichia japonica]